MIYSIPAMTMQNEFINLDYVGKYVDQLVKSSGDEDYRTVYEWDDSGPGNYPPFAVLVRVGATWERRPVLLTADPSKKDGFAHCSCCLGDINDH